MSILFVFICISYYKTDLNFGDSQNITLTKSKYNLQSKLNLRSKYHFFSVIARHKKVSPYLARRVNIAPQAHYGLSNRQHRF